MNDLKGFWSYVHADDHADGGRIQRLAKDVAEEYAMQTGDTIELFLDRDDLSWGDNWRQKVDESLSLVAFFIPILTPRFFQSNECRRELRLFVRKAKNLGLEELILPLLYVDVPLLHEELPPDDLTELIQQIQWVDWREHRFEEISSTDNRRGIADLARRLVSANKKIEEISQDTPPRGEATEQSEEDDEPGSLDLLAAAEEAFPMLLETLKTMSTEVSKIGDYMNEATNTIHRADSQGKGATARLVVAKQLAKDLEPVADKMITLGNEFTTQLYSIDQGVSVIIDATSYEIKDNPDLKPGACSFFEAVQGFAENVNEMAESTQEMIAVLESFRKLSRDLRRPMRKLKGGLSTLVEATKISDGWVRQIDDVDLDC